MADLLQLAPSDASTQKLASSSPKSSTSESATREISSDQASLSQVVLRWNGSAFAKKPSASLSTEQTAAMHRLVKRIAQLRSVNDSSLFDSPQSLLPHVAQEAQAVLKQPALSGEAVQTKQPFLASATQHFESLAPWLLWSIAQSTHEALRLIEGITAQVNQTGWQSGILRLVVILELETQQTVYAFDLVTLQPAASILAEDCQVQIQDSLLGQQPTPVATLLQRLVIQITTTEPSLKHLFQGYPADWLIPYQPWQTGFVRLRLGLEFVPGASHAVSNSQSGRQPVIKFTQPTWLEQHITATVEHQLTQVLQHSLALQEEAEGKDALAIIVKRGCIAIDALQCSLALASRTFAQQSLPFNELALRLLWGINRTAYDVMQFTSGIPVSLLQPQQGWTTGSLRFVVYLTTRAPEQVWRFDLAKRSAEVSVSTLAETAMVQSCNFANLQPQTLGDLEVALWQSIEQGAPEIALLRLGTEVNVMIADAQWQTGVIQLETSFEFTPDAEPSYRYKVH